MHETVVTAFVTWFEPESSLDEQRAAVEQMKAVRDRMSAQAARQKELLISISVRAPSFMTVHPLTSHCWLSCIGKERNMLHPL